jgi:two-component system aerobic respiration control sensor histidine kinase ArcB
LLDDALGNDDTVLITSSMKYDDPAKQSKIITSTSKQEITQEKNSILLVEDQLIAAKVVNIMLDKLNCHVDVASDGKIAVQLAQEKDYDLIFMDIGLPEIDGYEATRRIRLNELKKGKKTGFP